MRKPFISLRPSLARGVSMKAALAVVVLVVYLIALGCYAQDTSRFQSVGGDFGKKMISTIEANDTKPAVANGNNGTLWSWGSSPKGTLVVNGNLIGDPKYSVKTLNVVKNWLGDSFVDPNGTAAPAYSYTDPQTGEPVTTYVDSITGQSYYTYTDSKSGRMIYVYFNPETGVPIYTSFGPVSGQYVEQKKFSLPPIFN